MNEIKHWLMIMVQLPAEPSRHRVAVWRELRKLGAVPAATGVWAAPLEQEFLDRLVRVEALCERGGGSLVLLEATPRGESAITLLHDAFAAARRDEWLELINDCGKFEAEIAREIAKEKFTFGELEEEEQSLDRLQRWFDDLSHRDVLVLDEAGTAATRIENCRAVLENYAGMVYERVQSDAPAIDVTKTPNGDAE